VIPVDAPVADQTDLFRRIHPDSVVWDSIDGRYRPSSGAFRKKARVSVQIEDALTDEGLEPGVALSAHPSHSLAAVTAAVVRDEDQTVERTPKPGDPAHGDVVGKKSSTCADRLARATRWEILREEFVSEAERAKAEEALKGSAG
jgi:hypothetical protein